MTPKLSLAAWVPAMDWKNMDRGAPLRTACIWVVMWERTVIWVGMSFFRTRFHRPSAMRLVVSASSVTGLMPRQASPEP